MHEALYIGHLQASSAACAQPIHFYTPCFDSRGRFVEIVALQLCSGETIPIKTADELIGKNVIYSRVILRCVLVGAMCADNVLELEAGLWRELFGKDFMYSSIVLLRVLVYSLCTDNVLEPARARQSKPRPERGDRFRGFFEQLPHQQLINFIMVFHGHWPGAL